MHWFLIWLACMALLLTPPVVMSVTFSGSTSSGVSTDTTGGEGGGQTSCTDGVDCYCDHVVGGDLNDTSLRLCEDFENAEYYLDTGNHVALGSGSPYDRGASWTWVTKYGTPSSGGNSRNTDSTPYIGTACGFALCSGYRVFCSASQGALTSAGVSDCWGPGHNTNAGLWFQRSGDFDAEIGTLTLTNGNGPTADIGAGNTSFAYRIPAGNNLNTVGNGEEGFTGSSEIGITMLHGFASNLSTSGVLSSQWKMEEWRGSGTQSGLDEQWNMGGAIRDDYFPYNAYMKAASESACNTALSGATVHVGSAHCTTDAWLNYSANGNAYPVFNTSTYSNSTVTSYSQSADHPFGTWGCHKAHISGMGTASMEIKIWNKGPSQESEVLVFHMSGFDGSAVDSQTYNNFWWNGYSNQHSQDGGTSATTYRYRDNVHIRASAPVSCSQVERNG